MASGISDTKLAPASSQPDHDYAPMETSASGSGKRKNPPATPTKSSAPPNKIKTAQNQPHENLVAAIEKLTDRIDTFGEQLTKNSAMVASVAKLVEVNAADIKECKAKVKDIENVLPQLVKENKIQREKVTELERYKRRWNLKIRGIKEKENEQIREEIISILSEIAPQWASTMGTVVDTVHRLGKREEGKSREVIIQFVMRFHRDQIWRLTKNSAFCKRAGISFKEDFCKVDREARAAAWPKMEEARAAGRNVYFKGPIGYIDGRRVVVDT